MKKITGLIIVCSTIILSCNRASNKEVNDANENLTEARNDLKDAKINANDAAKEKAIADWNHFNNESDSVLLSMENDLAKMEVKIGIAGKTEKRKLEADYKKTKSDLAELREKLRQRNAEFEKDVEKYDNSLEDKNESFKREFRHDMNALGESFKNLFKNNVK